MAQDAEAKVRRGANGYTVTLLDGAGACYDRYSVYVFKTFKGMAFFLEKKLGDPPYETSGPTDD